MTGIVTWWIKLPPKTLNPLWIRVLVLPLLLMSLERSVRLEPLRPTRETQVKFLAPGFTLAQLQPWQPVNSSLSTAPSFCNCFFK